MIFQFHPIKLKPTSLVLNNCYKCYFVSYIFTNTIKEKDTKFNLHSQTLMEVLHKIKLSQDIKNCRIELVRSQNPIFIKKHEIFWRISKKTKIGIWSKNNNKFKEVSSWWVWWESHTRKIKNLTISITLISYFSY